MGSKYINATRTENGRHTVWVFGRVAWCLRMAHRAAVRCQGTNITFLYETVIHFDPPHPPPPPLPSTDLGLCPVSRILSSGWLSTRRQARPQRAVWSSGPGSESPRLLRTDRQPVYSERDAPPPSFHVLLCQVTCQAGGVGEGGGS